MKGTDGLRSTPAREAVSEGCGTTRHCVDHGWCHRCNPKFSVVMSEINHVLHTVDGRGMQYTHISRILRGGKGRLMSAVTAEASGLAPFSGDDAVCQKCSHVGAATQFRAHGEAPEREEDTQSLGDTWPERLERQCGRCRYQWDEALNPPAGQEEQT